MSQILGSTILCLSYFRAKPEYRNELIRELLSLIEPTRSESGCIHYELFLDNENPNFLVMSEKFVDEKALKSHEQQPYILRFVEGPMSKYCEKVTWNVMREIKES